MKIKKRAGSPILSLFIVIIFSLISFSCQKSDVSELRFEISFPSTAHNGAITGRVFIMISKTENPELSLLAGSWGRSVPFFGVDVEGWRAGDVTVIDGSTLGYPPKTLKEIPAGEYFVQALVNIYTEFKRSDGHVLWAHMDQWEGQHFNRSPGNLYSDVKKTHLDPSKGYSVSLSLDHIIPPVELPEDTEWVKHVKIQSKLLTEFWGHPIDIGAIVLLPKGYEDHPDVSYPVHYKQGHFSLRAPNNFTTEPPSESDRRSLSGFEFYKAWTSDDFPRMFVVTFQHPCPYFDDSYAVNSANCGPYGDALVTELIPYLESQFRMIPKPYARVLSGGSTGGWESLALQVFYPDFFGGTWPHYPDPIDFRYYILTNIYEDKNAFEIDYGWNTLERPFMRDVHGQVLVTMRELSRMEAVLGSKGRSGQQLDIWQAVYGPVGEDGYPRPIWDKLTGEIDHEVAAYFKENYDLRHIVERDWTTLGPKLKGKIHMYCGDMDNYYLGEAVYELEAFLESTQNPYYEGVFAYGRPRKGHGWTPFDRGKGELERAMATHIADNAPAGENPSKWLY